MPKPTFEEFAAECRRKSGAATKGPWAAHHRGNRSSAVCANGHAILETYSTFHQEAHSRRIANVEFSAHNRAACDVLLEMVGHLSPCDMHKSPVPDCYLCEAVVDAFDRAWAKVNGEGES